MATMYKGVDWSNSSTRRISGSSGALVIEVAKHGTGYAYWVRFTSVNGSSVKQRDEVFTNDRAAAEYINKYKDEYGVKY